VKEMHDCRRTKERLLDLVYDEHGAAADALRAEVEACRDCRAEYRVLTETLRAYVRATAAAEPPENFWAGYHARLANKLRATAPLQANAHDATAPTDAHATAQVASPTARLSSSTARFSSPTVRLSSSTARLLSSTSSTARLSSFTSRARRALTATWRVPAPVAVAAALLIACLSAFALRPAHEPFAVGSPAQASAPLTVRTIEAPVVRERVVTRTVYVARGDERRARHTSHGDESRPMRAPRDDMARAESRARGDAAKSAAAKSVAKTNTLVGFRPAADVRLRVIKGNYANEK
jgi:hypothetical protein